jgi:hypothetical protein
MTLVVLLLVLALIFFGVGFALHALWWIAVIAAVAFIVTLLLRAVSGDRAP